MKKIFSFLAVALLALGFTACEDIPAPYGIEDEILGDGSKTLPYVQSFENSLGAYKSYTLSGEGRWINDHKAAVASGYNSADQTTTAGSYILVSPEISTMDADSVHFVMDYVLRYFKTAENQQVWITKNFDESKPAEGWTQIPVTLESVNDWNDVKQIDVNIPTEFIGGKIRLALYYNTPDTKGSTWQVKSLSVLKGAAGSAGDKPAEGVKELPYGEAFATEAGAFQNYTTSGAGAWKIDFKTAKATGYDNESKKTTAGTYYFVSPEISLAGQTEVHAAFEYILMYNKGAENQRFLISTEFDEKNPTAGWSELKLTLQENERGDWNSFKKADVQIPAEYMGKTIRLAYYYNTNDVSGSTWEVKNFNIAAGKAEGGNTPDVKPGDAIFSADMTSGLDGMKNYLGTNEWKWEFDSKFSCAKASGHVGGKEGYNVAGVAYLVSPEISLENVKEAHVAYESAIGYMTVPEDHQVLISANFNESAPAEGWTVLKGGHEQGEKFFTWIANDVQVPAEMLGKKVRIAFRYSCNSDKVSTWEVRNLKVLSGKASEGGNEGGGTPDTGDVKAANGDFETWVGGEPNNWQSASTASKGNLYQSEDAHSGKYSVQVEGNSDQNMRLSYKEIELKAGSYTMTFFTKAVTAEGGSVRPGFTSVKDGKVGQYVYGEYVNGLNQSEWLKVVHTLEIPSDGTYCVLIMNAKKPGHDVLIDDFTLTDASGKAIIK